MPLYFSAKNILDVEADVIVNAANSDLRHGGGVCGVIHNAAGPLLDQHCRNIRYHVRKKPIPTGSVVCTAGHKVGKAKAVFHAVGPIYDNYFPIDANMLLAKTYKNIIKMYKDRNYYNGIVIPAISCGIYGFPIPDACNIAVNVIRSEMFLNSITQTVILSAFDPKVVEQYIKLGVPSWD